MNLFQSQEREHLAWFIKRKKKEQELFVHLKRFDAICFIGEQLLLSLCCFAS